MRLQLILAGFVTSAIAVLSPLTIAGNNKPSSDIEYLISPSTPSHLPFSEAVRVDNTVYLSGQIGLIPGTGQLANESFESEALQVMNNIKATLETHHMSMANLIKCTVMLTDIEEFGSFNKIYKSFFQAPYPARSAFVVKELALGSQLEVECIAAVAQ